MKYLLLLMVFVFHPLNAQVRVGGGDNSDYDKPKNPIFKNKVDHPKHAQTDTNSAFLKKLDQFSNGLHRGVMKCHRNGSEILGRSDDFLNLYNKIAIFRDLSVRDGLCNNEAAKFFQCLITPAYKKTIKELIQYKEFPTFLGSQYALTPSEASQVIHFFNRKKGYSRPSFKS
jgi:hypothetical protein